MITTIVPVYNAEKTLIRCLDSILSQTYKHLEVIVVDDGSTDSSPKICDEYALKNARVKVIHQENHGALKARLNALKHARGEWISFVDSDDWIEHDMYSSLLEAAQPDSEILWGEMFLEYKEGRQKVTSFDVRNDAEFLIRQLLRGKIQGWMCNKLIKRELFFHKDIDMSSAHTMFEDVLWTLEMLLNSPNVTYISKPLYHYNLANDSAVTAGSPDRNLCKAKHNIGLIQQFLERRGCFDKFTDDFSVLAMRYKIAEANTGSIEHAKDNFSFAHRKISAYPLHNTMVRFAYWMCFNTGKAGELLHYLIKHKR